MWIDPAYRGRGIAAPAMAAVVEHARRVAPLVTLYVNHYNAPALATYRRVGFEEIGRRAMTFLRPLDDVAYIRFASVYRDFDSLERFIEEIRGLKDRES